MKIWLTAALALTSPAFSAAPLKGKTPVVVELFTSEGCSSCPPADDLLAKLAEQPIGAADIIVLSEHVDYWDHLGWKDPFSSNLFSARQQGYGDRFHLQSVYTPQMVVDGVAQLNGSDSEEAKHAIWQQVQIPKASVSVSPLRGSEASAPMVNVHVDGLLGVKVDQADVLLAVTEGDLRNSVASGENSGRSLKHTGVVRSLTRIAVIDARKGAYSADLAVTLAPSWKRQNVRVVILVQDRRSRRIAGAAYCML